jgi:ABC-type branched-subunit amino acid transport system ATPase component
VENVTKRFGGLEALKDVTFYVHEQQIKALIGPNGAGKSTMFNLIAGADKPSEGRISFRDIGLVGRPAYAVSRLGVGRTFQHSRLFDDLSVLENVMVGRYAKTQAGVVSGALRLPRHHREEHETEAASIEALKRMGLVEKAGEQAGNLPVGERHLLEIARALATEPALLLLDEPAAGLNDEETACLSQYIRKIRDDGITVLLVEHDMGFVMDISDEVVVLDYGEKIAEGSPLMVQSNEEVIRAYLGEEI